MCTVAAAHVRLCVSRMARVVRAVRSCVIPLRGDAAGCPTGPSIQLHRAVSKVGRGWNGRTTHSQQSAESISPSLGFQQVIKVQ